MVVITFETMKRDIIQKMNEGIDFSPKGSIDLPIRELVSFLNSHNDYVTTSSCSGRISIYRDDNLTLTKSIRWLLVQHSEVTSSAVKESVLKQEEISVQTQIQSKVSDNNNSLSVLKCEGFILHILCRDIDSARTLYALAMGCGFRESGLSIGTKKIILAIRTTAFGLELPIACGKTLILNENAQDIIVKEANTRLRCNFARIDKFLNILKKNWQWPILKNIYTCNDNPDNMLPSDVIKRWGHSIITVDDTSNRSNNSFQYLLYGGYGVQYDGGNIVNAGKSTRLSNNILMDCVVNKSPSISLEFQATSIKNDLDITDNNSLINNKSMHSVIELWNNDGINYILVSGGRSSPLDPLSCLTLFNKDDMKQVFIKNKGGNVPPPRWGHSVTKISANSYFLYGGRNGTTVLGDAYILELSLNESIINCKWIQIWSENSSILPRFFHAACGIMSKWTEHQCDAVVIHGGLTSLENDAVIPTCSKDIIVIYPRDGSYHSLLSMYDTNLNGVESSNKDRDDGHGFNYDDIEGKEGIKESVSSSNSIKSVSRFGHTITSIGAQSLLLIGGTSYDDDEVMIDVDNGKVVNSTYVINLYVNDTGKLCGHMMPVATTNCNSNMRLRSNNKSQIDEGLPCECCRVHHQSIFNNDNNILHLVGGGSLCMGFGAHFCQTISLAISHKQSTEYLVNSLSTNNNNNYEIIDNKLNNKVNKQLSIPKEEEKDYVIVISSSQVKKMKIYLEKNNWIDKKRRIAISELLVEDLESIQLLNSTLPVTESINSVEENTEKRMSLPVISDFMNLLKSSTQSNFHENLNNIIDSKRTNLLLYGKQIIRQSKSLIVNVYRKANEYLESILAKRGYDLTIPSNKKLLPKKYEIVGDVLMLPENSFCNDTWNNILGFRDDSLLDWRNNFWFGLTLCFTNINKIGRKGLIEGEKRESTIKLLYPELGRPELTGPNEPGWVNLSENGISFGFDITRVMFCSGNITERIRMSKQDCKNQVIVDLYCGIGYYTMPFLVYGGASHIHACEWNPNSILSLKENLKKVIFFKLLF
jgi:tRNA wybutosine-synthesizing protein 3